MMDLLISPPPQKEIKRKIESNFISHKKDAVKVGVSDGVLEVSPERELSLWKHFPIGYPVEEAVNLVAPKIAIEPLTNDIERVIETKKRFKIAKLTQSQLKTYLFSIKNVFRALSTDWIVGESSIKEVIESLKTVLRVSDAGASRIFRTETTSYFNESRHAYFNRNTKVDFIQLFAVTDGRITPICDSRHGFILSIERAGLKTFMPPFHWNCRTIQRALISALSSHARIIKTWSDRVREDQFVDLPLRWAA